MVSKGRNVCIFSDMWYTWQHVGTVWVLRREHADLVKHMENVGRDVLGKIHNDCSGKVFGFHRPPFNSIEHLHLHCIGLPWGSPFQPVRFQMNTPWFMPVGILLKKLLEE